jgi:hypothetical protein
MTDKATAAEEIPTFDDQGMFAFLDKWLVLSSERRTPEVEPGSSRRRRPKESGSPSSPRRLDRLH